MSRVNLSGTRESERGQTIILVALSVVSLFAMAALAVDVITLYVAKGEIQHAADAAALAGAKAFVESTVTTDPLNPTLQSIARNIATGYIAGALQQNPVSGSAATLSSSPVFDFTAQGNPRITVAVQRSNLPIFFARIWSSRLASTSATAKAEAYNPSWINTSGGYPIVAPQCVKPLLLKNQVLTGVIPVAFVSGSGTVNSPNKFVGHEFRISLSPTCGTTVGCIPYTPQVAPTTHNFCSSCAGATDYERSIACCDGAAYNYTQCGAASSGAASADLVTPAATTATATQNGMQCLIHASGPGLGNGQDALDTTNFPAAPMQIQAGTYSQTHLTPAPAPNSPISTSDSIVTLPIYGTISGGGQTTIVGFLHAFVNYTLAGGDVDVTILNIVGCGFSPGSTPAVSGGGVSPIPVRLIH